ncbi:MAG: UDP-N-acetylglucosamine 2-epimerase [Candidatus Aenigmarchaeota archaeon]|nr:UDP-N-acetylglucosamine 2-epimerase [Candidatus Aenigmarchaeota archaeon]
MLPITLHEEKIKETMEKAKAGKKWVIAVVTATKPDFYKQWSILTACEKLGIPNFVIHTGQHYDEIVGHGLDEFGLRERFACDLAVRGELLQKSSELITKIGWFGKYLKQNWPGVTVLPVVHGDTLVAAVAPIGWMFSRNEKVAQNEAGLRAMAPNSMKNISEKPVNVEKFINDQWYGDWHILRNEPFPEQWDTFVSGAGSEFLFAPTELNQEHLLREGYPSDRVFVVGNSIVDAAAAKMKEKSEIGVFDAYPKLEKKDDWIRVDMHRRENLTPRRFEAIIGGVKDLVEKGYNICFIELNATKTALEQYGMRKILLDLNKKDNFLFTGVWPKYAHVIEFLNSGKCFAELTDSGSMQEELNELGKVACLTCRFSTDRPETVFKAHTNILIPPTSKEWIAKMVEHVHNSDEIRKTLAKPNKLYGKNVGNKIAKIFLESMANGSRPFRWAHEVLNLWKEKDLDFSYL